VLRKILRSFIGYGCPDITLVFRRSNTQEAVLQELLAAQQLPTWG
jgi:hypothetical protein